jgi:hypothetical protein
VPPGDFPTIKVYDAVPLAVLHLKTVAPPGIVAPGGGLVITAAFGAVCSGTVCGSACSVPFPAVIVIVLFVPAGHPAVDTDIVADAVHCSPGIVTDGADPIRLAQLPDASPKLTVPL